MSTTSLISLVNFALYLAFYTAYSKSSKTLEAALLWDVLFVRKSLDFTLVELNKVLSLTGLTNLCLALLLRPVRGPLLWQAMLMLWTHTAYSAVKFYGSAHIPKINTWTRNPISDFNSSDAKARLSAVKKFAIVLGWISQILLAFASLPATTLAAAVAHFYSMEVDYKFKLGVRPYAYLPFPLAALGIALYVAFG